MKIICVGRNYLKHIKEMGNDVPSEPALFMKPETSILPAGESFELPDFSNNIHYEVEVVLKIARKLKNADKSDINGSFTELTLGIDFTARDLQNKMKNSGTSWEIAKAFDHSAVIGDFLPVNNFRDINHLGFRLEKNGQVVQESNTSLMLFKYEDILAYASKFFTLLPGDLIFTGTPDGVGAVEAGNILEGFMEEKSMFTTKII